jgi:hypothetical protein
MCCPFFVFGEIGIFLYIRPNKFFGGESKSIYTQKVILEEVIMFLQINARK